MLYFAATQNHASVLHLAIGSMEHSVGTGNHKPFGFAILGYNRNGEADGYTISIYSMTLIHRSD